MIEKLKDSIILKDDCPTGVKPNNDQIVAAINEIIDKVNELDIKLVRKLGDEKIMSEREDLEVLRYAFLSDWVDTATKEEIIEKLIQNDERAKKIKKIEKYARDIVDDDTYKADWRYDVNGTKVRRDLEELLKDE